jgi:crotonobetainyl-CoA:carnitine CoA-transferase CaiB-like acyl-CoA transferase
MAATPGGDNGCQFEKERSGMENNNLQQVAAVWALAGLPPEALAQLDLPGQDPVMPSSFAVGSAAQISVAAAALAAAEVGFVRTGGQGARQSVQVPMAEAAMECTGWFSINGHTPEAWDKFSGLYPCRDGWVRIHTNFTHHRDGALALLGLASSSAEPDDVRRALLQWDAGDFEQAASDKGMVVSAVRSFDEWDAHPQAQALASLPLMQFERIGEAEPLKWPDLAAGQQPLSGLRVLDLTRIIAGPVGGRTLAAYGADVMLVNSPHLPNIDSIMESSRGKLSVQLDLRAASDHQAMRQLVAGSNVFIQGYRPGGLSDLGFGAQQLAQLRPGIVAVSLSAYGQSGPWANRRGFDSLVQTATGFNHAEAQAFGSDKPKAMPVQILDFATGFFIAYAVSAALQRQQREGGSWHVTLSLAQTANWLRSLGRVAGGPACAMPDFAAMVQSSTSGWGELRALRHSAGFSHTPAGWTRPSMPPGSHLPLWP